MTMQPFRHSLLALVTVIAWSMPTSSVMAHGGVAIDLDTCRIEVDGHWVHFTAYTPATTADTEYCKDIPDVGLTNIVFDYEGKALRRMTVDFEITKEPEGNTVYKKQGVTVKTGTLNLPVDFTATGDGKYLAHVTLHNEGKTIDAHNNFVVGSGSYASGIDTSTFVMLIAVGGVAFYLFWPGMRKKAQGKVG